MSDLVPTEKRARDEAAAWLARLNRRSVSLASLEAFRTWRQTPQNRAAYESVEATWRRAGDLKDDPDIKSALKAALAKDRPRGGRRGLAARVWAPALGMASLAGIGFALAIGLGVIGSGQTYATHVGEQRLVRLADGSSVRLDTDTRLAVSFSRSARHIRLERGQAYFEVAHDRGRPFTVDAGPLSVRAVGTKFDVRQEAGGPRVTLVEGVVQVRSRGATPGAWTLKAGEQVILGKAAAKTAADVGAATSWTSGHLVFQALPLSQAIDEVNRYSVRKIRLNAPAIANVAVNGVFETGDTDAFVAAACDLHALRATRQSDGTIVLDPNPSAAE